MVIHIWKYAGVVARRRIVCEKNRRCTHRYFPVKFVNVLIYVFKAGADGRRVGISLDVDEWKYDMEIETR